MTVRKLIVEDHYIQESAKLLRWSKHYPARSTLCEACIAAFVCEQSQDAEYKYQHGIKKGGEDTFASCSLLDQLRGAGSLPECSESTSGNADSVPIERKASSVVPEPVTPPTQEDYINCPDRPCLLRLNRSLGYQKGGNKGEKRWLRMNTGEPFTFETKIFKGSAVLYVAGLDTSPPGLFQVGETACCML